MERRGAIVERWIATLEPIAARPGGPTTRSTQMYQDGSSSARARSARIRASHDYEATELEAMRRRGAALDRKERPRATLMARVSEAFARTRARGIETVQAAPDVDAELVAGIDLNE